MLKLTTAETYYRKVRNSSFAIVYLVDFCNTRNQYNVVSRVMRNFRYLIEIYHKGCVRRGGGAGALLLVVHRHPLVTFQQAGHKGSRAALAARLALDTL